VLVLLNFLLAIVVGSYEKVLEEAEETMRKQKRQSFLRDLLDAGVFFLLYYSMWWRLPVDRKTGPLVRPVASTTSSTVSCCFRCILCTLSILRCIFCCSVPGAFTPDHSNVRTQQA
jgi:hypothetical protein